MQERNFKGVGEWGGRCELERWEGLLGLTHVRARRKRDSEKVREQRSHRSPSSESPGLPGVPTLVSAEMVPGKGLSLWTQRMVSCVSTQQGTLLLHLGLLIRNGYWLPTRPLSVKVLATTLAASQWFFL